MLFVDKQEDLAGLPEWFRQSAAEEAKAAGQEGKWLFTLHNASRLPFLQYSANRPLREQIYKAYINRGNNNDKNDNKKIITDIVSASRKSQPVRFRLLFQLRTGRNDGKERQQRNGVPEQPVELCTA